MAGIPNAELTAISLFIELVVAGDEAESVTKMQYHVSEDGVTAVNVAVPDVNEDCVWTNVDPVLQVEVVDEYSLAV